MARIHATAKKVQGGFVPMFMIRDSKGQLRGSIVPKGESRDYRLFSDRKAAIMDALSVAYAVARDNPDFRIA